MALSAAPATITLVPSAQQASAARDSSIWNDLGGRGLAIGEDFLRKLLGLSPAAAAAAPGADVELLLAQQRASQQRTMILIGGGLAAVVLLVVLLKK